MPTSAFFYQNYLTSITQLANITVTGGAVGQSPALVSTIQTVRQGPSSAVIELSGTYTSAQERLYVVEIHVIGTGAFGSAQYRWSDTGGTTWNASNQTTVNGGSFISLSHGITFRFLGGLTTPQFANGDRWYFYVSIPYGPGKMADGSRDSEWRTGNIPSSSSVELQFDLGTSVAPGVISIYDENVPSNGTVTLMAKTTGFTDPPNYTQVIPAGANGRRMALISPSAFRYWRLRFAFVTAPTLGYLRVSELFLGAVERMTRTFNRGFQRNRLPVGQTAVETLQRGPGPWRRFGDHWSLRYEYLDETDQAKLLALHAGTQDATNRVQKSFYWLPLDTNTDDFQLVHWVNGYQRENASWDLRVNTPIEFSEVIRSVA